MISWCFGIISPAIFHKEETFVIAKPFLNQMYSTVCHQANEKTISINGENLFVCSRCAGIYSGLLIVGLFSFFIRNKIKYSFTFLVVSFLILLTDVVLSSFHIYEYSKAIALSTGVLLGSTIILFVSEQLNFFKTQNNHEK